MRSAVRVRRGVAVGRSGIPANPLQPASLSLKAAERVLRRQLPELLREMRRIEAAKVVSQEALNFRFVY